MKAIEKLERLKRLHGLIKQESTGTAPELGRRLRISRRQVYRDMEELEQMGGEIGYSGWRKTYYFKNDSAANVSFP